ncbi:MAG: amidase [Actinomycetota bacterium]|nr:amidase [Actinomycetota bacterium]
MAKAIARRDVLRGGVAGAGMWLAGVRIDEVMGAASSVSGPPFRAATEEVPTSSDDLAYLTIAEAAELIRTRRLSPVELVDACLDRIERHDKVIQAWVTVLGDEARAEARRAADEIARSGPRSPLHGIPIGQKDLYDMKGIRTTAGSKIRTDAPRAKQDSSVVASLRAAGAIALGKTNTHEFAYGVRTPPTSNPWDTTRIPGGSSGGTAAALAAGMCLGGSGSDTGGSIRIPSSLCNTVGIKPTFGRVSKAGLDPLAWSLDHAGPLARSVEDCALMLNVIAGPDRADPTTASIRAPDFTAGLGKSVRDLVVGVPTSIFFEGADPQTEKAVRKTIPALKSAGVKIKDIDMPSSQQAAATAYLVIQLVEPLAAHEHYLRTRPHDYQTQTQLLFALGTLWTGQHYMRAQRIRTINIRQWMKVFDDVDAVLAPTTPRPAPTKEEGEATGVFELVNYTSFFDFNGCPSISVPADLTQDGLPVGLMLSARPFNEQALLRLAYAYQKETGFNRRRPKLD